MRSRARRATRAHGASHTRRVWPAPAVAHTTHARGVARAARARGIVMDHVWASRDHHVVRRARALYPPLLVERGT
eukprot:3017401-Prymnesium_polylepis.1